MTTQSKIFPCGCDESRVRIGMCHVHQGDGTVREGRTVRTVRDQVQTLVWQFSDRAKVAWAAAELARDGDSHSHIEQSAIYKAWDQAARELADLLCHEGAGLPQKEPIMLGVSFKRILADGTRERVDPSDLRITVAGDASGQSYELRAAVDRG